MRRRTATKLTLLARAAACAQVRLAGVKAANREAATSFLGLAVEAVGAGQWDKARRMLLKVSALAPGVHADKVAFLQSCVEKEIARNGGPGACPRHTCSAFSLSILARNVASSRSLADAPGLALLLQRSSQSPMRRVSKCTSRGLLFAFIHSFIPPLRYLAQLDATARPSRRRCRRGLIRCQSPSGSCKHMQFPCGS